MAKHEAEDLPSSSPVQDLSVSDHISISIEQEEKSQTDDALVSTAPENDLESKLKNETSYDEIENILNNSNNNQVSAYQQLFRAWNHNYNDKVITTACKQAEALSLRCLHKQGNLNSLKAHNRPAVLKLVNNDGQTRHITVTSIQDELATVYTSNEEYIIKLSDLDRYWYGQFILLWRKPDNYSSAIKPGDSSNIVTWLSAQFADEMHDNNFSDSYDAALIKRVKAFQTQHGLAADGIVGPVTIIHLNTQSGMDVPTLTTSDHVLHTRRT